MPDSPDKLTPRRITSPVSEKFDALPKPPWLEGLTPNTVRDLFQLLGGDLVEDDLDVLEHPPLAKLVQLRNNPNYYAYNGSLSAVTPDHGKRMRAILDKKITELKDAARAAGGNTIDSEEAEQLRDSLTGGQHPGAFTTREKPHPTIESGILADIPQVSPEELDLPEGTILGRFSGPDRNVIRTLIDTPMLETAFLAPVQTQYVRIVQGGKEIWMRYSDLPEVKRQQNKWEDIPPILGVKPAELIEQHEGFGDEETPEGQQLRKVRKQHGGASHTHWKSQYNPKPRTLNKKP